MIPDGYANIRLSIDSGVARLVLNRPDKLNPVDSGTVGDLLRATASIEANPDVTSVVIAGEGPSFSAGGDLEEYAGLARNPGLFRGFLDDLNRLLGCIDASRKIYVAAVHGHCMAEALELILVCDIVIAGEGATLGASHMNCARLPGAGGSQRLGRTIGHLRAKCLVLTGEPLTANAAREMGLVSAVVPDAELEHAVERLLRNFGAKTPVGLAGAKHLFNMAQRTDLATGLAAEMAFLHRYATTEPDAMEGLRAFREKRRPRFGDR